MEAPVPAHRALNVLIVDDHVDAAESLAFCLELDGRQVRFATSGAEALELLAGFTPDVALVDIVMPQLDGHALARELRRRLSGILLIAVTGASRPAEAFASSPDVFDHHLMKPLDFVELQRLLPLAADRTASGEAP